ncbi:MAG TPA: MFS transporter [Steroidobacteraceae bacterium]|nr:MFS transporter [Steroidobacteraceae bacterium]
MSSLVLNLQELIDGQKFGRFNLNLLVWSFLAMVADGFDLAGLASAAPDLARTWHLAPKAFAPALSASLFGILLGAPLLGHAGDRFGRKTLIVAGCLLFSLGTLATVWAATLNQIVALRVLTGIGIGGLMPNAIALNSELAPKRLRATLVVLMFTGITAGAGLPGAIQAWLIPHYGWQVMFWVGGLAPLIVAAGLQFALPESVTVLAAKPRRRAEFLATVRRLRRDLAIPDAARFVVPPAPPAGGLSIKPLFSGSFAWMTPLLWVCFASALMANFFLNSWLPLIFESNGLTPKQNGIATSLYHYGGTIGGLLVSLVLGRFGFAVIAVLFLLATLAIAAIGLPGLSYVAMVSAVTVSGFCTLGAQFGNNAASGLLYPTAFRSSGVGWALGIGRFGSIAGPLVGGMLIGLKVPPHQFFLLAAVPMAVGLAASASAARLRHKLFGGFHLDELTETPASPRI